MPLRNEDLATLILSYFGKKCGYGDLRGASKERLLEVRLELRVLWKANNVMNRQWRGIKFNEAGEEAASHWP